ncbi:MAG: hypothetical protein Q8R37_01245 [Nanoarchaeota archaeon]|nr:hypothetical protein [Nanoarchaeota archaeon]
MKPKLLFVMVAFVIILSISFIFYSLWPRCFTFKALDTSLTVESGKRPIIGINANTDSLAFGKVSPDSGVLRSIKVNYSDGATVRVAMDSSFASWVNITPATFSLPVGQSQEVAFDLYVPADAAEGSYNGTVIFCFQE